MSLPCGKHHGLYVRYRVPIHHPPKLIFCSAAEFYGTFVWKGSVEKYEKKLDEKVRELIKEINTIAEQENEIYGDKDLEELGEGAEVTSVECETVFGQIKGNQRFRRFYLRGREKVGVEIGLLLMGYNIKNLMRKEQEKEAA